MLERVIKLSLITVPWLQVQIRMEYDDDDDDDESFIDRCLIYVNNKFSKH